MKVTMQMQQAILANDLTSLNSAILVAVGLGLDVSFAYKKKSEMEKKSDIITKLGPALASRNLDELRVLIADAERLDVKHDRVTQAQLLVERSTLIESIHSQLKKAAVQLDLAALDEALKMSIELGLDSPEVIEAQGIRGQLEVIQGAKSQLLAAEQLIAVKAESGLVLEDLEPLSLAISRALDVSDQN